LCPAIFREIWRHCNGALLLCPINATSSSSYVFRLQYPEVIHCRIVPIEKLKTLVVFGRRKPPNTVVLSEFKRSNLKVTRKVRENSSWATWQGGEYFHETFVRHHINLTKYTIFIECLWLMIKTINICVFNSNHR
jgi:hypothetical protein